MSDFRTAEIAIAVSAAVLAQLAFVGLFFLPPPAAVEIDFSDENARPLAVAITPVPLLKAGSKNPSKLPDSWKRAPAVAKTTPPDPKTASPSTKADPDVVDPKRDRDASVVTAPSAIASASATPDPALSASAIPPPASSQLGANNGSADGTETDPLKAKAADMYRAQLASWFAARFAIRGKVPFETLQKLSGAAVVTTSSDRHVTGFTITKASGDPTFDAEVRATLSRVQSGGAELPAPPPAYPDMLTRTFPVSFRCTIKAQCE